MVAPSKKELPASKTAHIFGKLGSNEVYKVWAYSETEATISLANMLSHSSPTTRIGEARLLLRELSILGPVSEYEFRLPKPGVVIKEYK